jgi:hypothetical protein
MTELHPLHGVDLKLRRAKSQLADLKQRIAIAFDPDRYRFSVEYDVQSKKHVYCVHDMPLVDPEWALEVGEIVYQLRSALDHLAWQLVLLDGGDTSKRPQFPVRDSPNDRNGNLLPLQTLMPEVKDPKILGLLNECQPYSGDGTQHLAPQDAQRIPLWGLRALNNVDKHRLLLVVICALDIGAMWWGLPDGTRTPDYHLKLSPLNEGSPVAWFDFHGAEPPPDFDPHPALHVVVDEPDAPNLSRHKLIDVLGTLHWWVETHILAMRFRPLFP